MIANFFLDNRIGGPHIYSKYVQKDIPKYDFLDVSCGKSNWSNINLVNIKRISKYLYFFELVINIFLILINKKIKSRNYFFVYSIFNIGPIIAGIFLRKKIYWFIIEDINFINKITFKFINFFFKINTICINKNIAKKLKLKKNYQIYVPRINVKFWRQNKLVRIKKKKLTLTMVGNINRVKNYFNFLIMLKNIKSNVEINIVGEVLKNQINYYKKIKNIKLPKNIKISFLGKKNNFFIKKLLLKSDVFCLPSLSEGTSLSMLEAMSMSKICLVSKESNISNIIKNNYNGFVFELNKKSILLKINEILLLNLARQKKIQKNARSTILNINSKFKL